MRHAALLIFLAGVIALAACAGSSTATTEDTELVVFAAASLGDAALDLADEFKKRHTVPVRFNFAGSNTLAQQIADADAADLFLSADADWVRFLEDRGRTQGAARALFSNRLVIVCHRDAALSVDDPRDLLAEDPDSLRHLAVADPRGVPAGRYARVYLEAVPLADGGNLWQKLAGRLAPTLDVRAALALVESDPSIVGLVYRTDATTSDRVRTVYEFPPSKKNPIRYWGVPVAGARRPDAAIDFLDFVDTPVGREILLRHGFEPGDETTGGLL